MSSADPLIMGILNVTPDSVSDGVRYSDLSSQVERAHELVEAGASLVDVGGESGRTDRPVVTAEEELKRIIPVVERLSADGLAVSCDTAKPEVARAAVEAGAVLVNDVSGLRDHRMADVCAETGAGLVILHTRAAPKQESFPSYENALRDVRDFLGERMALAVERGVGREQIILDPGPDYSKTPSETVEVLRGLAHLRTMGQPLLLAVSRKYFIGVVTGRRPLDRLAGTLAALAFGLGEGVELVRVHDVHAVTDFLKVRAVLQSHAPVPAASDGDDLRWMPAGDE